MTIPQTAYTQNMPLGFAGMIGDHPPDGLSPCKNAEVSAEMRFGIGVKLGTLTGVTNQDLIPVVLPAAEGDTVWGITVHSHAYALPSQLGDTGVKATHPVSVMRKGKVLVVCEDGCNIGDKLWIRCTTGGDGAEFLGSPGNADEGTETIDCTNQGTWLSPAAAGGLAWLEVDFNQDAT